MKEYKIWKFIPGKYLQTVTVSLEEEYPCKQKRCGYSCLGDKTESQPIIVFCFYLLSIKVVLNIIFGEFLIVYS